MIDKKDKIITLKSGKEYVIINNCLYNNVPYYFACQIENGKPTEEFKILTITKDSITNKEKARIITDDTIIKNVCAIIDKME